MSDSQGSSADQILLNAQFGRRSGAGGEFEARSADDVLRGSFDAAKLHPLAGVGGQGELDYLFLDDGKLNEIEGTRSVLPSRGWGDELCCASSLQRARALTSQMAPGRRISAGWRQEGCGECTKV